jgi:hypothetical protein
VHVGLLDHRGEGLLGHPPWFEEAWEVAALAQLGDAQLHGAGARLPKAIAVAVALDQSLGALLAVNGAGQLLHFQLHQPLGSEADHVAQQIGVGVFSTSVFRLIIASVIGGLPNQVEFANRPYRRTADDQPRSRPPATALWGARVRAASLPPSYTITRDTTSATVSRERPMYQGLAITRPHTHETRN